MFLATSFRILYRAILQWSENGDSRQGAALAYYTLFSVAPLLLIAIQIAGAVFGEDAARGRLHDQLGSLMVNEETADGIEKLLEKASKPTDSAWTTVISVAVLVVSSLGSFLHVRATLCMIWRLEPPHGNTWLAMLWDYIFALIMVVLTTILLLISVAFSLLIHFVQSKFWEGRIQDQSYWEWTEIGASFLFLTLLFAALFRVLSGGRIDWRYVIYGSGISAVLFTIGKWLFSYYLVYTGTASMYGAAGSIVVFLMWIYYSSQTLFFGAELIQARRTRSTWMNAGKPA